MELKFNRFVVLFITMSQLGILPLFAFSNDNIKFVSALLNASYKEMDNAKQIQIWRHLTDQGIYGTGAERRAAEGYIYYEKDNDWCEPVIPKIPSSYKTWIALIERGNCEFVTKILHAKRVNASAVIIFDNDSSGTRLDDSPMRCYGVGSIVAVSISKELGIKLASIFEYSLIHMHISIGRYHYSRERYRGAGNTSVLFVLVSFILLMCISLAWLVFYYVQKFRYSYARDKKEVGKGNIGA